MLKTRFVPIFLIICSGCASLGVGKQSPQLLENEKYNMTSEQARIEDRNSCLNLADQVVLHSNPYGQIFQRALLGAVIGSATGAISGAILEDMSDNIAAGAAVGTAVGTGQALIDQSGPSESYQRFVEDCLQDKGYKITGWRPAT